MGNCPQEQSISMLICCNGAVQLSSFECYVYFSIFALFIIFFIIPTIAFLICKYNLIAYSQEPQKKQETNEENATTDVPITRKLDYEFNPSPNMVKLNLGNTVKIVPLAIENTEHNPSSSNIAISSQCIVKKLIESDNSALKAEQNDYKLSSITNDNVNETTAKNGNPSIKQIIFIPSRNEKMKLNKTYIISDKPPQFSDATKSEENDFGKD